MKLTHRQQQIADNLKRLVGPGAASFYKDACRITEDAALESGAHVVAHLLREVESSLREVLLKWTESEENTSSARKNSNEGQKEKIRVITNALGYENDGKIAEAWLFFADRSKGLAKQAHRNNLSPARRINEDFEKNYLIRMEDFLIEILRSFENKYGSILDKIDDIAKKEEPSKDDIMLLCRNTPNNYHTHYRFFNQLKSPKWLPFLAEKKFFSVQMGLGQGQSQALPSAPYLKRMATTNPWEVANIFLEMENIEDELVKVELLKIVVELPKHEKFLLKKKIKDWLDIRTGFFLSIHIDCAINLVERFVKDQEEDSAFEITEFCMEPSPQADDDANREYERFLQNCFPILIKQNGNRFFKLICDSLVSYFETNDEIRFYQRPAIEDHEQNRYFGNNNRFANILISTIRDIGLKLVDKDSQKLPSLISDLENRKLLIFQRIILYFLSEFPELAKETISRYLTNKSVFDNLELRHEQYHLMKKGFCFLDKESQQIILSWIDGMEKYKQRDRLSSIADDLPQEWKKRYLKLTEELGESKHPDFTMRMGAGWGVGSRSNISSKDMIDMGDNLIEVLGEWKPPEEWSAHPWETPTREGLGRELKQAVIRWHDALPI